MNPPATQRCLFCDIANKTIPSHTVYEDDAIYAFLDINPIRPGHTLIVPRAHHAYFDDLPPELASRVVAIGQRIARSLKSIHQVQRAGFMFTGTDIAHTHAHVVPLVEAVDITSRRYIAEENITFRPTPRMPDDELAQAALQLRQSLD